MEVEPGPVGPLSSLEAGVEVEVPVEEATFSVVFLQPFSCFAIATPMMTINC